MIDKTVMKVEVIVIMDDRISMLRFECTDMERQVLACMHGKFVGAKL